MKQLTQDRARSRCLEHDAAVTEFDQTTALCPTGRTGEYEVELDAKWSSLVGAHGGYMAALAVRAAQQSVPDRQVRTLSTSFVRSGRIGQALITTRVLRTGRSIATVVADLSQGGELLTTTRLTLVAPSTGVEWVSPIDLGLPPPEDCVPLAPPERVVHFERADALIDPSSLPFTAGERARVSGYFRPLESRPVDAAWLAMAVDWFPPPAFVRIDPPTGGISVDLTTHVHRVRPALATGEWLTAAFEVTNSTGGLAVEHGVIAERDGTVLAESFHTRLTAKKATS